MKKPIKIISAIVAFVFTLEQVVYPAPHSGQWRRDSSALRPIASVGAESKGSLLGALQGGIPVDRLAKAGFTKKQMEELRTILLPDETTRAEAERLLEAWEAAKADVSPTAPERPDIVAERPSESPKLNPINQAEEDLKKLRQASILVLLRLLDLGKEGEWAIDFRYDSPRTIADKRPIPNIISVLDDDEKAFVVLKRKWWGGLGVRWWGRRYLGIYDAGMINKRRINKILFNLYRYLAKTQPKLPKDFGQKDEQVSLELISRSTMMNEVWAAIVLDNAQQLSSELEAKGPDESRGYIMGLISDLNQAIKSPFGKDLAEKQLFTLVNALIYLPFHSIDRFHLVVDAIKQISQFQGISAYDYLKNMIYELELRRLNKTKAGEIIVQKMELLTLYFREIGSGDDSIFEVKPADPVPADATSDEFRKLGRAAKKAAGKVVKKASDAIMHSADAEGLSSKWHIEAGEEALNSGECYRALVEFKKAIETRQVTTQNREEVYHEIVIAYRSWEPEAEDEKEAKAGLDSLYQKALRYLNEKGEGKHISLTPPDELSLAEKLFNMIMDIKDGLSAGGPHAFWTKRALRAEVAAKLNLKEETVRELIERHGWEADLSDIESTSLQSAYKIAEKGWSRLKAKEKRSGFGYRAERMVELVRGLSKGKAREFISKIEFVPKITEEGLISEIDKLTEDDNIYTRKRKAVYEVLAERLSLEEDEIEIHCLRYRLVVSKIDRCVVSSYQRAYEKALEASGEAKPSNTAIINCVAELMGARTSYEKHLVDSALVDRGFIERTETRKRGEFYTSYKDDKLKAYLKLLIIAYFGNRRSRIAKLWDVKETLVKTATQTLKLTNMPKLNVAKIDFLVNNFAETAVYLSRQLGIPEETARNLKYWKQNLGRYSKGVPDGKLKKFYKDLIKTIRTIDDLNRPEMIKAISDILHIPVNYISRRLDSLGVPLEIKAKPEDVLTKLDFADEEFKERWTARNEKLRNLHNMGIPVSFIDEDILAIIKKKVVNRWAPRQRALKNILYRFANWPGSKLEKLFGERVPYYGISPPGGKEKVRTCTRVVPNMCQCRYIAANPEGLQVIALAEKFGVHDGVITKIRRHYSNIKTRRIRKQEKEEFLELLENIATINLLPTQDDYIQAIAKITRLPEDYVRKRFKAFKIIIPQDLLLDERGLALKESYLQRIERQSAEHIRTRIRKVKKKKKSATEHRNIAHLKTGPDDLMRGFGPTIPALSVFDGSPFPQTRHPTTLVSKGVSKVSRTETSPMDESINSVVFEAKPVSYKGIHLRPPTALAMTCEDILRILEGVVIEFSWEKGTNPITNPKDYTDFRPLYGYRGTIQVSLEGPFTPIVLEKAASILKKLIAEERFAQGFQPGTETVVKGADAAVISGSALMSEIDNDLEELKQTGKQTMDSSETEPAPVPESRPDVSHTETSPEEPEFGKIQVEHPALVSALKLILKVETELADEILNLPIDITVGSVSLGDDGQFILKRRPEIIINQELIAHFDEQRLEVIKTLRHELEHALRYYRWNAICRFLDRHSKPVLFIPLLIGVIGAFYSIYYISLYYIHVSPVTHKMIPLVILFAGAFISICLRRLWVFLDERPVRRAVQEFEEKLRHFEEDQSQETIDNNGLQIVQIKLLARRIADASNILKKEDGEPTKVEEVVEELEWLEGELNKHADPDEFFYDITIEEPVKDVTTYDFQLPYGGNVHVFEYKRKGDTAYTIIDTGPAVYYDNFLWMLKSEGIDINKVERLLITHGDVDHSGAMEPLHRDYPNIDIWAHEGYEKVRRDRIPKIMGADGTIKENPRSKPYSDAVNLLMASGYPIEEEALSYFERTGEVLAPEENITFNKMNEFDLGDSRLSIETLENPGIDKDGKGIGDHTKDSVYFIIRVDPLQAVWVYAGDNASNFDVESGGITKERLKFVRILRSLCGGVTSADSELAKKGRGVLGRMANVVEFHVGHGEPYCVDEKGVTNYEPQIKARRVRKIKPNPDSAYRKTPTASPASPVPSTSVIDLGTHKQIFLSLVPKKGTTLEEQVENILINIDKALEENGLDKEDIVKQSILLKDIIHREYWDEIFGQRYRRGPPPATSYIQQPPINGEYFAVEIIAAKGKGVHVKRVNKNLTIVEEDGMRWAYGAGIEPDEGIINTYEQARSAFGNMKDILEDNGFKFEHILRTWLYERDITGTEDDESQRYQLLNEARKYFFTTADGGKPVKFERGLPASTGIGMSGGTFVMECLAISTDREDVSIVPLENPKQVSAFKYPQRVLRRVFRIGGDVKVKAPPMFSRGMLISTKDYEMVLVSGTASIRKAKVRHKRNVKKQTETTIKNIELVLKQAGLTLSDVPQLRVYVKNKEDYEKIKAVVDKNFPNIPCLYLQTDVCRDNLLVEIEAMAYFPHPGAAGTIHESVKQIEIGEPPKLPLFISWLPALVDKTFLKYFSSGYWGEVFARRGLVLIKSFLEEVKGKDTNEVVSLIEKHRKLIQRNDMKFKVIWCLSFFIFLIPFLFAFLFMEANTVNLFLKWAFRIFFVYIFEAFACLNSVYKHDQLLAEGEPLLAGIVTRMAAIPKAHRLFEQILPDIMTERVVVMHKGAVEIKPTIEQHLRRFLDLASEDSKEDTNKILSELKNLEIVSRREPFFTTEISKRTGKKYYIIGLPKRWTTWKNDDLFYGLGCFVREALGLEDDIDCFPRAFKSLARGGRLLPRKVAEEEVKKLEDMPGDEAEKYIRNFLKGRIWQAEWELHPVGKMAKSKASEKTEAHPTAHDLAAMIQTVFGDDNKAAFKFLVSLFREEEGSKAEPEPGFDINDPYSTLSYFFPDLGDENIEKITNIVKGFPGDKKWFRKTLRNESFANMPAHIEIICNFVKHIFENYETKFLGGRLVFIGGSCNLIYVIAKILAPLYGINEEDIILMYMPVRWSSTKNEEDVYNYMKSKNIFDGDKPIFFIDNGWLGSVPFYLRGTVGKMHAQRVDVRGLLMTCGRGAWRYPMVSAWDALDWRESQVHLASEFLENVAPRFVPKHSGHLVKREDESVDIDYPQLNNDKDIINAWGLLRQVIIATRAQRDGSETEPGNFGKGKHILPFILGAIAVLWSGNAFAEGLLSLVKKFPAPSFFVFSSVCMACLMIYLILYEQPARFRPKRFDVFIDELAEKAKSGQGIRVLSAGCHTGKETYNVAAALLKRGIPKESIKVVGIDNSEHRITKAKRGIYGGGWATHYYLHRYTLDNYFEKLSDGSYKVKQGLRDIVEFRECDIDDENAMSSLRSSFGLFDGVICWGVLYSGNKKARKNLAFVCKDDASLKVDNGECVVNIRKMISKRKARSSPDRDPLSELRKPHLLSAAARDDEEVFGETATDGRREAQEQLKQKIIEHINASPDVAPAIEELKKIFEELMAESGLTKTHFDQVIKELCDEGVVERIRVSNEVLLRTAYIKKASQSAGLPQEEITTQPIQNNTRHLLLIRQAALRPVASRLPKTEAAQFTPPEPQPNSNPASPVFTPREWHADPQIVVADKQVPDVDSFSGMIYRGLELNMPQYFCVPVKELPLDLQRLLSKIEVETISDGVMNAYDYLQRHTDEIIFAPPVYYQDEGTASIMQSYGQVLHGIDSSTTPYMNPHRPGKRVIYIHPLLQFDSEDVLLREFSKMKIPSHDIANIMIEEIAHREVLTLVHEQQLPLKWLQYDWGEKAALTVRLHLIDNQHLALARKYTLERIREVNIRLGLPENDFGFSSIRQDLFETRQAFSETQPREKTKFYLPSLYEILLKILRIIGVPYRPMLTEGVIVTIASIAAFFAFLLIPALGNSPLFRIFSTVPPLIVGFFIIYKFGIQPQNIRQKALSDTENVWITDMGIIPIPSNSESYAREIWRTKEGKMLVIYNARLPLRILPAETIGLKATEPGRLKHILADQMGFVVLEAFSYRKEKGRKQGYDTIKAIIELDNLLFYTKMYFYKQQPSDIDKRDGLTAHIISLLGEEDYCPYYVKAEVLNKLTEILKSRKSKFAQEAEQFLAEARAAVFRQPAGAEEGAAMETVAEAKTSKTVAGLTEGMRSEGDVHRGDSDIIPIAVDQELINKEGVKAYVLDLDGTVIDTLDKAIDLWAYIYWKIINGIRDDRMPAPDESDLERGRKFIQDTAGHGMPDQIAQIIKDAKGRDAEAYTLEEAITMYEDGYRKMFDKLFESRGEGLIFPRTKNFFDEVKRRRLEGEDIVLVQTSGNSTRILDHVLDRLGLQDIFGEHVYGSDPPYIKGRPHNKSDVIRLMKEQFGLKDHEITMYGDSLGDVKAGKDGGALTVVSARNEDEFKVREGAKPSFITRGEGVHPAILDVLNVVGVGRPGEESGQKLSLHKEIEHCQLIAQAA